MLSHAETAGTSLMRTAQALVAVGGAACRLRGSGIEVGTSKAFMPVRGRPVLYWNLLSLHVAGIRCLVLCGNRHRHLNLARRVVQDLRHEHGVTFPQVEYVKDPGLGVHGLPFQARRYLDDTFIFECGHSLMRPEHYQRLDGAVVPGAVVFSAFEPHPVNRRQPVLLDGPVIRILSEDSQTGSVVAHPFLLDREYVAQLPDLSFDIWKILRHLVASSRLRYVVSDMPPEFDLPAEYVHALPLYEAYARQLDALRARRPPGTAEPALASSVFGGK
jgi:hypothetical protein